MAAKKKPAGKRTAAKTATRGRKPGEPSAEAAKQASTPRRGKPTLKKSATKKSATKKSATKKSATKKSATKKSARKGKTAALKTTPTVRSVDGFLAGFDEATQADCRRLIELMSGATGAPATMWGPSIVGFGDHHYRYESGREGDFFEVGFSPRKKNLTLYITPGFAAFGAHMQRLGSFTTGRSCIYIKRLSDLDTAVLRELLADAVKSLRKTS